MKATCSKCGAVRNSFEEMLLHNSGCKGPNIVRQMNVTVSRLPESVIDELEQHLMEVDDEHGLDSQQVGAFQQLVVGYGAAWDAVETLQVQIQEAQKALTEIIEMAPVIQDESETSSLRHNAVNYIIIKASRALEQLKGVNV